jgi:hypothetical protein
VGGEFTPSGASNELWLAFYPRYRAQAAREIAAARRRLGITVLRVFLHSLLWDTANSAALLENLDDLLAIAAANQVQLGFVFFDSCWNDSGASTAAECEPVAGVHNSCWMQSPQAAERAAAAGNVSRFEPYVSGVTRRFGRDPRVAWLEIYNEPRTDDAFVLGLRAAAYGWAKAMQPTAPVLSCWDYDTPNISDSLDIHAYDVNFATTWAPRAFAEVNSSRSSIYTDDDDSNYERNDEDGGAHITSSTRSTTTTTSTNSTSTSTTASVRKSNAAVPAAAVAAVAGMGGRGALFTEAGCRSFQVPFSGDAGSPLAVVRFLRTLRARRDAGLAPFVPGALLAWEVAVGNSNTRWHWGSAPGAPEPAVPWCGMLFPDGTPVSYTEAAALRNYTTGGHDDFLCVCVRWRARACACVRVRACMHAIFYCVVYCTGCLLRCMRALLCLCNVLCV